MPSAHAFAGHPAIPHSVLKAGQLRQRKRGQWPLLSHLIINGQDVATSRNQNTWDSSGSVADSIEKSFNTIDPSAGTRMVAFTAFTDKLVELFQQFCLIVGQVDRRLNQHTRKQVTDTMIPHRRDSLSTQAKHLTGLGTFRNFQRNGPGKRRQVHLAPESCDRNADRHLARQVSTIALEQFVRPDSNLDVQVARRATVAPNLSFAR